MQNNLSILVILKRLWQYTNQRRKKQFSALFLLMIFASLVEVMSIGSIFPFLAIITAPERVEQMGWAQPFLVIFKINNPSELLLPLTLVFCVAACVSAGVRLLLVWASAKFSFNAGSDLSIDIYRKTLYQPYAVHILKNSSEIIDGISAKTQHAIGVLTSILNCLASAVMVIAISAALLYIEPLVALIAFTSFGSLYACVVWLTHKRLRVNSQKIARNSTDVIKSLQEGLNGIRDVLITGTQAFYSELYRKADLPLKKAHAANSFMATSPRYAMEGIGLVLIATLTYLLSISVASVETVIPTIGALAMGAQRLLPLLQNLYLSWAQIIGGQASLRDVLMLLEQPLPQYANDNKIVVPIKFNDKILLQNVSFQYDKQMPLVLKNIELAIKKGSRVGFVGTTGSGKSTLLDIVMGLLVPSSGTVLVDGVPISRTDPRAWQSHIAHVPQSIYLADTTIAENIAFGVPWSQIRVDKLVKAAELAQIADTIDALPLGYETIVGERGVRLSGGQRQRIGIARALYRDADVIIFDEATSALDSETEQAVIAAIRSLSTELTILTIAHRESTIRECSLVYRIVNGRLYKEEILRDG